MNRKLLPTFLIVLVLVGISGCASAPKGGLGDESWTAEERVGRVYYLTHGTAVWGHEFGFYKSKDCADDILWLTFSASDEKVKNFNGKETLISLKVGGKDIRIKSHMHYMGVIGRTQIMYFYDWVAGPLLMDALKKGRYVEVRILEPKGLEELLDIKHDEFSLRGLVAAQKKANSMCAK